ncbi:F-box domain-containing protein [Mycena sanguinolenta]|uniref:F-box domain-containing protein n=1 Tax=Mycena sanguinolenta TaxID=230812 RepID=A0A8H7CLW4_9AGAR|nr:F-box domain-containing protein [Mycena sanguinolenta]
MTNLAVPVEILLGIFYWLDGKAIVRCCSVCRLWRETVESSTELQYSVELWAEGLGRGYESCLDPVDKMQKLHRWRRAWRSLDWTSRTVIPIESNPRAYELVGGVFAQQNTWPESDFTAIQLPTMDRDAQISTNGNIGVHSHDFAMDPTQDLVVFLHQYPDETGNFELKSLSTLGPHPLALSPRISFPIRDHILQRIFLQVAEDVVGLLFRNSESLLRLVIFNWRTGTELVDLASPQFPNFVSDFALMSPGAYILASTNDSTYRRGLPTKGIGEIHIFTFKRTHSESPHHVATLQLPHINSGRSLHRIIAHSGPFCALPIKGAQFNKSNDKRICVISLAYDMAEFYQIYVHHRYFERYFTNDGVPLTILWEEWGPQNSRMLSGRPAFWLRYVHGERVVCPVDPTHPSRVEVLDFGISPSRPGFDDISVAEPTTLASALFKKPVTTFLPYCHLRRDLPDQHHLFLIDQDRLIGVNERVDKLTVYIF